MKLAIGYSSKDQIELTHDTFTRLLESIPKYDPLVDILWADASRQEDAVGYFEEMQDVHVFHTAEFVAGGADAAIAWKLTKALQSRDATHIMLLENDVLLDEDWFEPTMALFEKGKADGLSVGAVSPRSYVDRVLIQRDGHAVMHNIGAGAIIFSREAAEIVLRSFRTHWWPDNVRLFAQLAGIDLRTYAAFRGNEQNVTTDWGFDAQLAAHGLASLALTPAKCQMIGQNPPLVQQGLELTSETTKQWGIDQKAFESFRYRLDAVRRGAFKLPWSGIIRSNRIGHIFYPHQLGYLAGGPTWQGTLELVWTQGHGPFTYRAGEGGASLSVRLSGICSFLVSGGDVGAKVSVSDTRSGFKANPMLVHEPVEINVPGGPVPRDVKVELAEGAMFYGLSTVDNQMLDDTFSFSWDQLPGAK